MARSVAMTANPGADGEAELYGHREGGKTDPIEAPGTLERRRGRGPAEPGPEREEDGQRQPDEEAPALRWLLGHDRRSARQAGLPHG
jgi:hypothetical protein